jgi:glycosyltransferase involved in cell wall biosynthesis
MGEMLAVGLPVVTNAGVGDVATLVDDMACGVAVTRFDEASYAAALDQLPSLSGTAAERRRRALRWFDVELGIERYDRIYDGLVGDTSKPTAAKAASKRFRNSSVE